MANGATIKIAPNVVQLSINGLYSTVKPITNVQYWQATTGVDGEDCAGLANYVMGAWQDHMLDALCDAYEVQDGHWVLLTTENSPTGTVAKDAVKNDRGLRTGLATQVNTAFLVHKQLASAGRSARNGRMFLAGALETDIDSLGVVASSVVTNGQAQLNTYFNAVKTPTPAGVAWDYVQPHWSITNKPPPETGGLWVATSVSGISGLRLDARAATQRQRMR